MSLAAAGDSVVVIDIAARFADQTDPGLGNAQKNLDRFTQSINREKQAADGFSRTKAQIILQAKDQASNIIRDVSDKVRNFAGKTFSFAVKVADYATRPLRSIFDFVTSLRGVITGLATGVAVKGTILDPIGLADQYKNAEIGFDTMLGSVQKGQQMMSDIQKFAIATPFSTSDVVQNTQTMMAYGFAAKDVINDMKIIGDQAAATGRGSEGLNAIALALGQMQAHGKVDSQDMNQLTSVGVKGWDYIAQAMGKTKAEVMDMSDKGLIPASVGVQAILSGMKEYNGMMDKMANTTASGLMSQIKDTFSINILTKWGQGLQKGVVGGLSKFSDWLGKNQDKIAKWGDALETLGATISTAVTSKVEAFGDRVNDVVNSSAFQKAGSLSDKIHILWSQVIVEPFEKWWSSSGQKWLAEKAAGLGRGLGSALTGGLLALLGLNASGAIGNGASIGGAFAQGFSQTFNGKKIAEAFIKDFKSMLSDAGKLLPGGKSADSTSWLSAAVLGYLGIKGVSGAVKVGKGVSSTAKGIGSFAGTIKKLFSKSDKSLEKVPSAATFGSLATETMAVKAAVVNVSGDIVNGGNSSNMSRVKNVAEDLLQVRGGTQAGRLLAGSAESTAGRLLTAGAKEGRLALPGASALEKGATDMSFVDKLFAEGPGTASKLGKVAEVLGRGGKAIPIAGTALAIAGGAVEVATAPKGQKARTAAGAGGSIAGGLAGAAAGAQLGAMAGGAIGSVVPGVGNAIGAGVGGAVGAVGGGIAGAIGGEKAAKGIYDKRNDIGKGLSTAGKAIGNFFTQTIPSTTKKAISSSGTFITKTIPGALNTAGKNVGKFFSNLPHATGVAVGRAAGNVQKFATQTAPKIGSAIGGFFTQTIPNAASKVGAAAGNFVTKTVPGAASTAGKAVGGFFTKTLPNAAQTAGNAVGNFVTKTVPGAAQTAGNAVGNFFTKTLPDAGTSVASSAGNFITKILPGAVSSIGSAVGNFFTQTIPNAVQSALSSAGKFFSGVGKTIQKGWNSFTSGVAEGHSQTSAHASGGFFSNPHVGLVAEDGPEAIIPLSGSRRSRSLSLWKQAGQMLGVTPYANGGITGDTGKVIPISQGESSSRAAATPPVTVTGNEFIFKIESSSSNPEDIVEAIKAKAPEVANALSYSMAKMLEKVFTNIPQGA